MLSPYTQVVLQLPDVQQVVQTVSLPPTKTLLVVHDAYAMLAIRSI
jgi:hypothetical protein